MKKPLNRAERVLSLLTDRYPGWVPAIELEAPGGRQAWRTAVSEARVLARAAGGDIENRTRRRTGPISWVLSEYRLKTADECKADPVSVASEGHNTNEWSLR
jgi:hypothetical protein